jgi:hypothetical protein
MRVGSGKVIARLSGGLGNQIFTYAAARRLALVNGVELVIDDTSGFVRDRLYRRTYQLDCFDIPCRKAKPAERLEPFPRIRRRLLLAINGLRPFKTRRYIQQEEVDFDSRLLEVTVDQNIFLEGYWQSERYFKDIEETIHTDLKITPPSDRLNSDMADLIRGQLSVAVHVRFFDALSQDGINNVSGDYYNRAVKRMDECMPGAHYFIFSDRPEAARERIPLADDRLTLVAHNRGEKEAYADLWLMTLCHHFIIANSTFSWWGAWLARHGGKQIIAPGFELREGVAWWGFDGLLPEDWMKC